jgi:rhamnosyltransferase
MWLPSMSELVSVIIRTLNEELHLEELILAIKTQKLDRLSIEIVIVDSGSNDRTLDIAEKYGCRITHIKKADFTFGRSLNVGCDFSNGKYLVFVSGHCIPVDDQWIDKLIAPLSSKLVAYSYGKQIGRDTTKFSERKLFDKYFPDEEKIPQVGFFCNNANSALRKDVWSNYPFDEKLTGLEDMYLAQKIIANGEKVGYVPSASVYHIHNESWAQVKNRYEREAIALQKIMPELHFGKIDFIKCFTVGVLKDLRDAYSERKLFSEFASILRFRFSQYQGVFLGNHIHRKLSHEMKMKYFYPRITNMEVTNEK